MQKMLLVISLMCLGTFGAVGSAFAGGGPTPWPGEIDCDFNESMCSGETLFEIDYKCDDLWEDDGTYVNVLGGNGYAHLQAEGGGNGWADCDITIYLESDDDVYKYEAKCEAPESEEVDRGRSGKTKDVHNKVELEIKASNDAICDFS